MAIIGVDLDGDQLVLTRRRDFRWAFDNLDNTTKPPTPVDFPPGDLLLELETGGQRNEIQRVHIANASGGFYTLGFDGETTGQIDYYDIADNPQNQPGDITDALEALSTIGAGNVKVSPVELHPVWRCDVQLTGSAQNEIQEIQASNIVAEIASWLGIPESEVIGKGAFKLRYRHAVTDTLKFDCTADDMKAELEKLPLIGAGNVTVTKPADYHWQVEFVNILGNRNVDQIEVDVYTTKQENWFDWITDLVTTVTSTTTQQGQNSAFDERLVNLVNKNVNDFFNLFDENLGVNIEFTVDNPTPATPNTTPSMSLVVTGLQSWEPASIGLFLMETVMDSLQDFLNSVLSWAHVWSVVSTSFHWDRSYTVEFVGDLAETPVPLMTYDDSNLTDDSNEVDPFIEVTRVQDGKPALTTWQFVIDGHTASLKVESEECDKIADRTDWQLYFLPDGEPAGGDPIALGRVRVQGD